MKEAGIVEFKAHLGVRPARGRLRDLKPLPPNDLDCDIVELLLDMRQNER